MLCHLPSHLVLVHIDHDKDRAGSYNQARHPISSLTLTFSINSSLTHSTQSGEFCRYQSSLMAGSTTRGLGNERKNYKRRIPHMHCQAIWWCKICMVLIGLKLYQPLLYNVFHFKMLCWIFLPPLNHGLKCRKNTWKCWCFLLWYNLLKWMWDLQVTMMGITKAPLNYRTHQ